MQFLASLQFLQFLGSLQSCLAALHLAHFLPSLQSGQALTPHIFWHSGHFAHICLQASVHFGHILPIFLQSAHFAQAAVHLAEHLAHMVVLMVKRWPVALVTVISRTTMGMP